MSIKEELDALQYVITNGKQLVEEAMSRQANVKQARLASELMGRMNTACKTTLEYRLRARELGEIEEEPADMADQSTEQSHKPKRLMTRNN